MDVTVIKYTAENDKNQLLAKCPNFAVVMLDQIKSSHVISFFHIPSLHLVLPVHTLMYVPVNTTLVYTSSLLCIRCTVLMPAF